MGFQLLGNPIFKKPLFQSSSLLTAAFAYEIFCALVVYSVIIWCSVRVRLHLRSHLNDLPEESRVRQLLYCQIDTILLLQALTPLIFELLPTCLLAVGAMMQYQSASLSVWMTFFLTWSPVVGALNVILAVQSYRQEVTRMLKQVVGRAGKESTGMVSPPLPPSSHLLVFNRWRSVHNDRNSESDQGAAH